jgi:urocanate hydratase
MLVVTYCRLYLCRSPDHQPNCFTAIDIGPQGIVHGTTITILNAGRKYLGTSSLAGRVFVSSGLGGMSGAQGKAAVICGGIAVIAEVDVTALKKRHEQGWVSETVDTLDACIARIRSARYTITIHFSFSVINCSLILVYL